MNKKNRQAILIQPSPTLQICHLVRSRFQRSPLRRKHNHRKILCSSTSVNISLSWLSSFRLQMTWYSIDSKVTQTNVTKWAWKILSSWIHRRYLLRTRFCLQMQKFSCPDKFCIGNINKQWLTNELNKPFLRQRARTRPVPTSSFRTMSSGLNNSLMAAQFRCGKCEIHWSWTDTHTVFVTTISTLYQIFTWIK